MPEFQICLCGSMPGYPHHPCCPRPCFSERAGDNWIYQFSDNLVKSRALLTKTLQELTVKALQLQSDLDRLRANAEAKVAGLEAHIDQLKRAAMAHNKDQGVLL